MIDQRNEQNHAALHLASAGGHEQLVRLLVSHGATINLPGGVDDWTPLFFSALAGISFYLREELFVYSVCFL
jgi:ankyrin repeat protein